jgi:uncharacterized DUF497 family protein
MDLSISELIVELDRPKHIAKHKVTKNEVFEIIYGDYVFIDGKYGRWLLIGKTRKNRFLTVVVGEREKPGIYGLVTARPSSKKERSFYQEFTFQKGG